MIWKFQGRWNAAAFPNYFSYTKSGFEWDNFLPGIWQSAVFLSFVMRIMLTTLIFWLLLALSQGPFSFPCPVGEEMHKEPGGTTAETAQPKRPKGYSTPKNVMPSIWTICVCVGWEEMTADRLGVLQQVLSITCLSGVLILSLSPPLPPSLSPLKWLLVVLVVLRIYFILSQLLNCPYFNPRLTHFPILLSTPQGEPGGGSKSGCMALGRWLGQLWLSESL